MADTPLLGNTYPDENQDPWWTTIRSYFLAKDEWSQVNYEDKSLLVYGGGTMTLIGSTFSWSAPLYIVSQRSVTKITIAASSLALADGEVLFVTTGVRPITNQTLVLQAGSPTTKNDIPIGYRSGATVHIKDLTFLSGYTLDDAYNASSGAASVSIDAGDVTWDTVGAYSLNVELSATTGAVDGFFVEDGTDYFRFIHKGVNTLDIKSELRDFDVNASGTSALNAVGTLTVDSDGAAIIGGASVTVEADGGILAITGDGSADIDMSNTGAGIDIDAATFLVDTTAGISLDAVTASNITVSGATADLTLGARSTSITLNEVGQTSLNGGFAATSIIGAINENYASIAAGGSSTLDDAYNNDAGAAGITVDAGDVTWSPTGDYSFIVDLAATTNTSDGFSVVNGTDQFNLIRDAANQISVNVDCTTFSLDASAAISIDSVANSNVSTTSADLTISTITSGELDLTSAGLMDINAAANLDIDVTGSVAVDASTSVSIDAATASNFTVSGATADLTLGARSTTITLNESGQTALSGGFAATSIIGAINENAADIAAHTLDDAYNADAGAADITIDAGDLSWDINGDYDFIIDLVNAGDPYGVVNGVLPQRGFHVNLGTDYFALGRYADNSLQLRSYLSDLFISSSGLVEFNASSSITLTSTSSNVDVNSGTAVTVDATTSISLDAATASNFTVSGATADLTLGARSTAITLNESGQTALSGGFAATSIIGAINENAADIITMGSSITLDDAYNNDAGAALITVDAGDVTWSPTGDYSFIVDLAATTNAADGFSVVNGADQFNLIRDAANQISVNVDCTTFALDASAAISIDSVANSNISTTSADLTISTITSGELDLTSAGLMDINAGANLDIDVTGTLAIDATSTIEWSGTNASLTSAGALTIASDFTLTGGGDIVTTANGNIDLIPNGTGITTIGGGTGSHSLNAPGDLFVSGELEVDGSTYLDGSVECIGSLTIDRSSSNASLLILSRSSIAYLLTSTYIDDGVHFGIGTTANGANRNFIFTGVNNTLKDHDHDTLSPNPTVFYHSLVDPDTDNTQWGSLTHDQTDFLIDSGTLTTKFASGLKYNVTTVNAATYDLLASDYIVHVTYPSTGAVTSLTLPTAQTVSGRFIIIKDANGETSTNSITVDTQGSETIDGVPTFVLNTDYQWVMLYSDGSNWLVCGG